ncbi:hypothetical protein [Sporolactobacillus pectinivorans]|uniref:hypothetical protein n=1 Tax=Sporolactobacillus pectinivorans TaxID=1591408 RepID=UPI0013902F6C|nr:hypothetical protein [Sporolactobacillus pectinivorans]
MLHLLIFSKLMSILVLVLAIISLVSSIPALVSSIISLVPSTPVLVSSIIFISVLIRHFGPQIVGYLERQSMVSSQELNAAAAEHKCSSPLPE